MAQEFVINSTTIEDKINKLLPSQGGLGAGVDFSASTMVIPIVDLTESAEGSGLREDLQSSLSFGSVTAFQTINTTDTLINTTGYFRVFGTFSAKNNTSSNTIGIFALNDGASDKVLLNYIMNDDTTINHLIIPYDFIVFLEAGHSLKAQTGNTSSILQGTTRQIADITGELVNP